MGLQVNSGIMLKMRCDRCLPVAAMLVLLCCTTNAIAVGSIGTHQVLVVTVVASVHGSTVEEGVVVFTTSTPPIIQLEVDDCIPPQFEKDEFHNLPPPSSV